MKLFRWLLGDGRDDTPMRDVAALVEPLRVPAVHVVCTDDASRSHFGGSANLPSDAQWLEREGRPLQLLARVCLTDLHHAQAIDWLPKEGSLLFFYDLEYQPWGFDPDDRESFAVLHVADLPEPITSASEQAGEPVSPFPYRNLEFRKLNVLPSWERETVNSLELSERECEAYGEIAEAGFEEHARHQVGGYPDPIQSDEMELECQLVTAGLNCGGPAGYKDPRAAALEPGAADWRLLFQIDTDDDLDIMWGDCGRLYFWVQEQSARAGDFSNAWVIMQCH